jgi:thiamine-monophosphate kinase
MSEWSRIAALRAALGGAPDDRVKIGIGDDAAVIAAGDAPIVWTIDASVEGVHFRRDLLSLVDVGYRATMAAASDLAAMGALPLGLLAALVLPSWITDEDLDAIARGQRDAAREIGCSVIGGNLARGGELSITTTALGSATSPLARGGAEPGDAIWMAGPVGLAAAGLAILLAGDEPRGEAAEAAVRAFRRPRARIAEGLAASKRARAAIDVSDGLAQDVAHLAAASGVRAILDADAIAGADLVEVARAIGRDPMDLALGGGEDYALVVVLPEGGSLDGFVRIGEIAPREGDACVALRSRDGRVVACDARGFDHFA